MKRLFERFSLKTILVLPLVSVLIIMALMSYVLFSVSHSSFVNEHLLGIERGINNGLNQYFQSSIASAIQILEYSSELGKNELLRLDDSKEIEKYILATLKNIENIDGVFYASHTDNSNRLGVFGVKNDDSYEIGFNSEQEPDIVKKYAVDSDGRYLNLLEIWNTQGFNELLWYRNALNKIYWEPSYSHLSKNQRHVPGILASKALEVNGHREGVFAVLISYSKIDQYLKEIGDSNNAIIYMIDGNRDLVATSLDTPIYHDEGERYIRYKDIDSKNDIIRAIADNRELGFRKQTAQSIVLNDEKYHTFEFDFDLENYDFSLIVALAESEVSGPLNHYMRNFLFILAIMVVLSMIMINYSVRLISAPLVGLSEFVTDLHEGRWGYEIYTEREDIIGKLIQKFNVLSLANYKLINELKEKQAELEELNENLERRVNRRTEELEKISITDDLTKLYNRRFLVETLNNQLKISQRYAYDVSIILIDIDYFKKVNDTYGHLIGDEVLKDFAKFLSRNVREATIVGRYGGEEFLLILPNTNQVGATTLAERIRKKLLALRLSKEGIRITISAGIASLKSDDTIDSLVHRADLALYHAKEIGRNNVKSEDELQK